MDRNTLIALVLVGLVLLLWPVYMKKVAGVKPVSQEQTAEAPVNEPHGPAGIEPLAESRNLPAVSAKTPSIPNHHPAVMECDTLILENALYRARLSTIGGGTLVSWKLKKHFKYDVENKHEARTREADWVELIPDSAFGDLSVIAAPLYSGGLTAAQMNFDAVRDTEWEMKHPETNRIAFVKSLPDGALLEKVFTTRPNSYYLDMSVRVVMPDPMDWSAGYTVQWNSGLRGAESSLSDEIHYYEAFALQGDELLKTKEKSTGLREGRTEWMSVRSKYFMMALISQEGGKAAELEGIKTSVIRNGAANDWKTFSMRMVSGPLENRQRIDQYTVYLGPIDYRRLKAGEAGLEKVMSFGWTIIKPFSIAFLYTLEFLYRLVGNYGWAIVIFSILIKIILFPLTRKSYQSMKAMQDLQPKITTLKEKYKKDPQRLNQETMKLYKEHGVNPMGGCLPMLLQMPVLFALFNLFRTTIMLRQASFLLIRDLSAPDGIIPITTSFTPDGINLLPILMGATMLIQQKLTTQNPQQKMMAYMMPVFLTFIFFKLSAGLNLYYLMFNILTIAQELLTKRKK